MTTENTESNQLAIFAKRKKHPYTREKIAELKAHIIRNPDASNGKISRETGVDAKTVSNHRYLLSVAGLVPRRTFKDNREQEINEAIAKDSSASPNQVDRVSSLFAELNQLRERCKQQEIIIKYLEAKVNRGSAI